MKKYKPAILISLTVLVALCTSLLVYRLLNERTLAIAKQRGEIVNVAVAVADMSWGTMIKPEMVKCVPFLKKSLPSTGFFSEASSVAGRVVLTPVKADEPIFESRLAPTDIKRGGVAAVISENKRAMSVKVDKVKGISGFIHPGNRVDVVATFRPAHLRTPVTMTVLENIPVLATGTETEIKSKQEKPVEVDVITLEVTPEEAEVLALASVEGKLQLSLRNYSDTGNTSTKGVTVASLVNLLSGKRVPSLSPRKAEKSRATAAVIVAPEPARDRFSSVEVIEGRKIDEVKFRERE